MWGVRRSEREGKVGHDGGMVADVVCYRMVDRGGVVYGIQRKYMAVHEHGGGAQTSKFDMMVEKRKVVCAVAVLTDRCWIIINYQTKLSTREGTKQQKLLISLLIECFFCS